MKDRDKKELEVVPLCLFQSLCFASHFSFQVKIKSREQLRTLLIQKSELPCIVKVNKPALWLDMAKDRTESTVGIEQTSWSKRAKREGWSNSTIGRGRKMLFRMWEEGSRKLINAAVILLYDTTTWNWLLLRKHPWYLIVRPGHFPPRLWDCWLEVPLGLAMKEGFFSCCRSEPS